MREFNMAELLKYFGAAMLDEASGSADLQANCSCNMHPHISSFKYLSICNLPLVPSWLLAVILGLAFSAKFQRLGPTVNGSLAYSFTFATYAVMISSGLVVHCLFLVECGGQAPSTQFKVFARIDESLTSCTAVSFLLNGLVDLKLIRERSSSFLSVSVILYTTLFFAYFSNLIPPMSLYMSSVIVCCGVYLLCQLVVILEHPERLTPLLSLLLAGVFGGGSLWLLRAYHCWLCKTLGPWSVQGVWYYGSDLSMICIGFYVWNTREKECVLNKKRQVDIKKDVVQKI